MEAVCAASGVVFRVSPAEKALLDGFEVPIPRLCPAERQRRRTAFRNFRTLCRRACSATGAQVISMYGDAVPFPVYASKYWWSDEWDAKSFGAEAEPDRPFFEQLAALSARVPRFSLMQFGCENSDFCNMAISSLNCYLVFGCVRNRDCLYGHIVWDCESCVDCLYAYRSQWCSNSIDIVDCYDVHYSSECMGCAESYFLYNCSSCRHCFGCFGLNRAEYCFMNEQCTKAEYERRVSEVFPLTRESVADYRGALLQAKSGACLHPPMFGMKNEDVCGNHIYESKAIENGFDVKRCEDSAHLWTAHQVERSCDISFTGARSESSYNCLTLQNVQDVICSHIIADSAHVAYSEFCYGSRDLFGCIGLRKSEYCILNRQYSRDDYFALRAKLVDGLKARGEWGEFFPASATPFAYDESIAQEYMPLSKEEAVRLGYRWSGALSSSKAQLSVGVLPPRTIAECGDDVLDVVFTCEASGKPFKVVRAELDFHRRVGIPLPSRCSDARHLERMKERGPRELFPRECSRCGAETVAAYSPFYAANVYCHLCYEKELQGSN